MRSQLLVICSLSVVLRAGAECGTKELPRSPVLHEATNRGQWRIVGLEGQTQTGEIITKENGNNGVVIRGHWAIGELELYEDAKCGGNKIKTLEKDKSPLAPLDTTWSKGKTDPDGHDFLESLVGYEKWYSEQRALDECYSSEFWSPCYQCGEAEAWVGWVFDAAAVDTEVNCIKIIQKDADPYVATRIALERWSNTQGKEWGWKKVADWKGLIPGRMHILMANETVAIAGAPSISAISPLALLVTALLSMLSQ
jgi:hypothetical protein